MTPVRILGVGGSLGDASSSLAALKIALEAARADGAETELIDMRELNLPMYNHQPDHEPPIDALRLADATRRAHGFVWSSPLYHGSMSGSFKNALDWLELLAHDKPAYLASKPVGLIATAGGGHALQGINSMEFAVRAMRGITIPLAVPMPRAWQLFDGEGHLKDAKIEGQLRALGAEVRRVAEKLRPEEPS